MTTRKDPDPVDRLMDVAVYAPLGFLLSARELLPKWTERGRRQLEAQLPMARTVGEIAVRQGSKQARATLARLRRQADEILEDMRLEKDPPSPPAPPPQPATEPVVEDRDTEDAAGQGPERPHRAGDTGPERPHRAGDTGPERPHRAGDTGPERPHTAGDTGPGADEGAEAADAGPDAARGWVAVERPGGPQSAELAIPGYDTLSASQVVQRLAGLSMEELEAVRSYELAGRARKTVLLRVAQLRAPT